MPKNNSTMKKYLLILSLLTCSLAVVHTDSSAQQTKKVQQKKTSTTYKYETKEYIATYTIYSDSTYKDHTYWKEDKKEASYTSNWTMQGKDLLLLWPEGDGSPYAYKIVNGNLMEVYEDLTPAQDEHGNKIIFKKVK